MPCSSSRPLTRWGKHGLRNRHLLRPNHISRNTSNNVSWIASLSLSSCLTYVPHCQGQARPPGHSQHKSQERKRYSPSVGRCRHRGRDNWSACSDSRPVSGKGTTRCLASKLLVPCSSHKTRSHMRPWTSHSWLCHLRHCAPQMLTDICQLLSTVVPLPLTEGRGEGPGWQGEGTREHSTTGRADCEPSILSALALGRTVLKDSVP